MWSYVSHPPNTTKALLTSLDLGCLRMYQVSSTHWSTQFPNGVKQIVVLATISSDRVAARQRYAIEQGYLPLAERSDGLIALYWDQDHRLVRLAIEPVVA